MKTSSGKWQTPTPGPKGTKGTRTGYPAEMLTVSAIGCGLFFALVGFLVVLTVDAFWLARRSTRKRE